MKRKLFKILLIVTVTVTMVCCCCFSASAANYDVTVNSFDQAINPLDPSAHVRPNGGYDATWVNGFPMLEQFSDSIFMFSEIPVIDNAACVDVHLDAINWWAFFSPARPLNYINLHLIFLDENYEVVYSEFIDQFNVTSYQVQSSSFETQITDLRNITKAKYVGLNLMADFNHTAGNLYFSALDLRLSVRDADYMLQQDINDKLGDITADKYTPPGGGDQIGDLTDTESQINENTSSGLNEVTDSFKAFSMSFFYDGLGGCIQLFNHIVPNTPWLNQILIISLGLGMFAFLVGSAQIVIGRLNSDMPRSARHDAKYIKRDGIASHRPSRK